MYKVRKTNVTHNILFLFYHVEPGDCSKMSHGKSEEMLECSYAIIPAEKGLDLQCDYDGNKEGIATVKQHVTAPSKI